ncbi:MAG: flagellar hook-basal body complex protein [Candidatus Puniceispirillales bacterium]
MSFYTALTGLNGASADISATSNNIANVGTTGFKRSRAEFGDIFATSPLQNASSSIGSGTILKGIKQQFTQGNISSSLNALDLAISGQGFFALKPSLTSAQIVYTRNGSLSVNDDRYVVDSAGQYLLVFPVNNDGSVTAKDIISASPLQLPVTSGEPQATNNIQIGVNVPAGAEVVTEKAAFSDGYTFNPSNPETYNNSTSITIFDDLGNPTIATIYFIKTQTASAEDPTNKVTTKLVINDTVIDPDLVKSIDDAGKQQFIDKFGNITTKVPDDNYFLEGKGSKLYKADDLKNKVNSSPAQIKGEVSEFDFGEEGDRLVEIVTDPMQFKATREAGNADSRVYWGKNFLTMNVDNGDQPLNIDLNPGKYNADQLAAEVQRAVNAAYGDDKKVQIVQNVDDTVNIQFYKLQADGSSSGLTTAINVDLLTDSYVSSSEAINLTGASPDFTRDQFLAHSQSKVNESLNQYAVSKYDVVANAQTLGVASKLFGRSAGETMTEVLGATQIVTVEHRSSANSDGSADAATDRYAVYSYYDKRPNLSVYDTKQNVAADSGNTFEFSATENTLKIYTTGAPAGLASGDKIRVAGSQATADVDAADTDITKFNFINGREFTVSSVNTTATRPFILVNTTGLTFPDDAFNLKSAKFRVLSDPSTKVEAYFEGADNVFEGSKVNFNSRKIALREIGTTNKHAYTNSQIAGHGVVNTSALNNTDTFTRTAHEFQVGDEIIYTAAGTARTGLTSGNKYYVTTVATNTFKISATKGGTDITIPNGATDGNANDIFMKTNNVATGGIFKIKATHEFDTLQTVTETAKTVTTVSNVASDITGLTNHGFVTGDAVTYTSSAAASPLTTGTTYYIIRQDNNNFKLATTHALAKAGTAVNIAGAGNAADTFTRTQRDSIGVLGLNDLSTTTDWVDEKNPPVKAAYDQINQRLNFNVDRNVLGTGTDSNFNSFAIYGASTATATNNLGIPTLDDTTEVQIKGGEFFAGESFVADGEEIQLNDKRFGIGVSYNRDTKTFSFKSGTTGETIKANGAIGVTAAQKSSDIEIGRYAISTTNGSVIDTTDFYTGDNHLMGVGLTKGDAVKTAAAGLAASPALATGAVAKEDLTQVFRLSSTLNETTFNVSVNGVNGIVEIPSGFYVGSTLAEALQSRINQIEDPITGQQTGGVVVKYNPTTNNFAFTTGTTGPESTIKVKGISRLGLSDVPLGVGSVPQIYNLKQATDSAGNDLFVDATGNVTTTPPTNQVDGFFPLYIDEGELTFDKTGKLQSPKNKVHYEKQEEGFSIDLNIDFASSTQFAQPFSVLSVEQDGFTSGRLDGLEIDASGTVRANYTNGQNDPLGKMVLANFNNQNGLKQIGNATYVETAVSGSAQVGEAGSEGFGTILSGSLERSNVDITEELVNLITAQRNFQASAKAIETTTTLTQTIINIRM